MLTTFVLAKCHIGIIVMQNKSGPQNVALDFICANTNSHTKYLISILALVVDNDF